MRNIIISFFSITCIYLLWPYIAVITLYVALQTADITGVKERIDWLSFKKELRVDLDNLVEVKFKKSLNKNKMQLDFDSLTLSKQISEKFATPEGLIYLFNEPNEFIEQIRQIFTTTLPLEKINQPAAEKKSFQLEGPNYPNLFERINYAFFVGLGSFRLSFNAGDLSFTMDWELQGLFWKLIRLKIPIKNI